MADTLDALLARLHPSWHAEAACAGTPTSWWFIAPGSRPDRAFECCARCPVIEQCRAESLAEPALDYGIRAGMTTPQRKAMRRATA